MSSNEIIAPVTQLETRKSPAETYTTFYELFNDQHLSRYGARIVLSRVLHIDETEDRSTHFAVVQKDMILMPARRKYDKFGAPEFFLPYHANDFMVASTDGERITEHSVQAAHGIYRARLNGTDQTYDPVHECMHLKFQSEEDGTQYSANFNRASGDGTVQIGQKLLGWILSEVESQDLRTISLQPTPEHIQIPTAS